MEQKTILEKRYTEEQVFTAYQNINSQETLTVAFNLMPYPVLLLNNAGQIIYANSTLLNALKAPDVESVLGLRAGEALNCMYARGLGDGCGTTDFCKSCGAVNVIMSSITGVPGVKECQIVQKDTHAASEYLVKVGPIDISGNTYNLASLVDISDRKRKAVLERVFFNDILDTARGLKGYAKILQENEIDPEEEQECLTTMLNLTDSLIDEVKGQHDLSAAEHDKLIVRKEYVSSSDLLKSVVAFYKRHYVSLDKEIDIADHSENVIFKTDPALLARAIGNLVKNGCEAIIEGQKVTVSCHTTDDSVEFNVHSPSYMPKEDQLQIFKRSFSTKGEGRGVGIFNARLFLEKFLEGELSFVSEIGKGTVFTLKHPFSREEESPQS